MWDLIVSVPDHCLSFYLSNRPNHTRVWFVRLGMSESRGPNICSLEIKMAATELFMKSTVQK